MNVSSPENILSRLQRSYADRAVSGGTVVKLDTKRNPLLTEQSVEVLVLKHKTQGCRIEIPDDIWKSSVQKVHLDLKLSLS